MGTMSKVTFEPLMVSVYFLCLAASTLSATSPGGRPSERHSPPRGRKNTARPSDFCIDRHICVKLHFGYRGTSLTPGPTVMRSPLLLLVFALPPALFAAG